MADYDTNEKLAVISLLVLVMIVLVIVIVKWVTKNMEMPLEADMATIVRSVASQPPPLPDVSAGVSTVNISGNTSSKTHGGTHSCSTRKDSCSENSKECSSTTKESSTDSSSTSSGNVESCRVSILKGKSLSNSNDASFKSGSSSASKDASKSDSASNSSNAFKSNSSEGNNLKTKVITPTSSTKSSKNSQVTESYNSKTRSDTSCIEVYSADGKRRKVINCNIGRVNSIVSGNNCLYVHITSDNPEESGIYTLEGEELTLVATTGDIVVLNMYMSRNKLVIVSNNSNYFLKGSQIIERDSNTYDKHEFQGKTVGALRTEDSKFSIINEDGEVETVKFPTKVRAHGDSLVYFDGKTGNVKGINGVRKVTSFDSNGYMLAYVKDSMLNILGEDYCKTSKDELECVGSAIAIHNNKVYVA